MSREVVGQLRDALALARPYASAHVLRVADAVATQMQVGRWQVAGPVCEQLLLACGARRRELLGG